MNIPQSSLQLWFWQSHFTSCLACLQRTSFRYQSTEKTENRICGVVRSVNDDRSPTTLDEDWTVIELQDLLEKHEDLLD